MQVIKNQALCDVPWSIYAEGDPLDTDNLLVPLSIWQENETLFKNSNTSVGLAFEPDDDLQVLAREIDLTQFEALAVRFPKAVDGRGYSLARMLRERYKFEGDLLAIGDVLVDQLWLMHRCGFNVLVLRPDQDIESALANLEPFSEQYQADALEGEPLFKRRKTV